MQASYAPNHEICERGHDNSVTAVVLSGVVDFVLTASIFGDLAEPTAILVIFSLRIHRNGYCELPVKTVTPEFDSLTSIRNT